VSTSQPEEDSGAVVFLRAVWRYRLMVLLSAAVAAGAVFALSVTRPARYEATARLLLTDPSSVAAFEGTDPRVDPDRYVRNRAEFLRSTPVLELAAEQLQTGVTAAELAAELQVLPGQELDLLTIVVGAPDARQAADRANAVAAAYQDLTAQRVSASAERTVAELRRSLDELRADAGLLAAGAPEQPGGDPTQDQALAERLFTLQTRIQQITTEAALFGSGVELVEEAQPPAQPVSPAPVRDAALAGVIALLCAAVAARLLAATSQRVDDRHDAAGVLGVPLLAEVPDFRADGLTDPVPAAAAPRSPAGESYQVALDALEWALGRINGRNIVITSARPGDGKTVTGLNLAIAAARDGRRVLVADVDLRVRGLTKLVELEGRLGFADLAEGLTALDACVTAVRLGEDRRLEVLPAGSEVADPAVFFRGAGFKKAINRLGQQGELVICDAPPVLAVSDTSAIAAQVDGIVVVVTPRTPLADLTELRARLEFAGTPILGYVYNRSPQARGRAYGYGERAPRRGRHREPAR
jgi:Mrp family chromosome partitioning ATPase